VVAISSSQNQLEKIKGEAASRLSSKELDQVRFLEPGHISDFLKSVAPKPSPTEQTVKGYRVKVQYDDVEDSERISKQQAIVKAILKGKKQDSL
jgi:hypothetical protein